MQRRDYERLLPLSYPAKQNVALLSFSINSTHCRETYMDSERLELRCFCRGVPCFVDEAAAGISKAREQRKLRSVRLLSYEATWVAVLSSIGSPDSQDNYMDLERLELRYFYRSVPCFLDEAAARISKALKRCEDYDWPRPLWYPSIGVFLMCFSTNSSNSSDRYMDSEMLQLCYFFRSSLFVIGDEAAAGIGRTRKQCLHQDRSWPLSYPAIDVILMCLRIDSSDSCVNIMGS
ncbi:hypothetical protein HPB51_027552 [Rhipicephalus microplus]|uniref:Uncharacterized protein n=1 Tax=Rhipicephalus microplus TaxID=6941 RepID=A0A9J6CZW7_RHIMP|nr:hypothetical protein HPB51_027552 [Rhipicephalus microplus]